MLELNRLEYQTLKEIYKGWKFAFTSYIDASCISRDAKDLLLGLEEKGLVNNFFLSDSDVRIYLTRKGCNVCDIIQSIEQYIR